jgi:hypothetical protein
MNPTRLPYVEITTVFLGVLYPPHVHRKSPVGMIQESEKNWTTDVPTGDRPRAQICFY